MNVERERAPYRARLIAAWEAGLIPETGLSGVDVRHDDWCPILAGKRICTCRPDIEVTYHQQHKGSTPKVMRVMIP
jgi:hypothetical protein